MASKRKVNAIAIGDEEDETNSVTRKKVCSESGEPNSTVTVMHFLVCKQGGSDKFYELSLSGNSVLSRYGRTGSKGATVIKECEDVDEARGVIASLLHEKLKKGYKAKDLPTESATTETVATSSCRTVVKIKEEKLEMPLRLTVPPKVESKNPENVEVHYLECKTGGSYKFYELKVTHANLAVQMRYGRIGSSGAIQRKYFGNEGDLQMFVSSTLREKLAKGYDGFSELTPTQLDDDVILEMELSDKQDVQLANIEDVSRIRTTNINQGSTGSSSLKSTDDIIFYLECKEGTSNKFYEIVVQGVDVTIRYGRIGAPGNPTTKSFGSHNEARSFAEKTAAEKKKKGYIEVKGEEVANTAAAIISVPASTAASNTIEIDACENPAEALENGKIILIQGSGKTPYKVKKFVGGYSCSCPGWIFQVKPKGAQRASCKHLRLIRGDDAEEERCGNAAVTTAAVTGSKNSSITSKITLAQQWKAGQNPKGFLMSEKLDGMRAYWTNGKLWTRNGNEIIAPDWFIAGLPTIEDLDGELFLGRQKFEDCMSIARRTDASNDWKQLKYVVFDCPTAPGGIVDRLKRAEELLNECENEYAILHPHTVCESEEELLLKLAEIEKVGGEGLMLRHPTAKHRGGRNTDLLKVKTFLDDEALVIDHENGKGKYEGMVGSLICINKAGTRFKVGSGLSDDIRSFRTAPQVGSVITFKYFELTRDGVPRFPIFMRLRPDVDASVFPK